MDRWFVLAGDVSMAESRISEYQIVKSIWHASVDLEESHHAWLDFVDLDHVETDANVVSAEPERYVKLPRFPRPRQVALLRTFSGRGRGACTAVTDIAEAWAAGGSPYRELLERLEGLGLRGSWQAYLRRTVEDELRAWASRHEIPAEHLFTRRRKTSVVEDRRTAAESPKLGLAEHELRAFLKAAIDQMTLAELGQLAVPARLLLRKAP